MTLTSVKVTKQYFRKAKDRNVFLAVKETDITIESGVFTEITGRSGSGKSTLLNMLSGLLAPTSGKVLLDGTDVYALTDAERSRLRNGKIGVIPQGHTALSALTVLENVLLPCRMYGEECYEDRAKELLSMVGISELFQAYPSELSGGELRRLSIARALIRKPGIILADEPTGDLDDENTRNVLEILRKEALSGSAVLLVTHEKEAEKYADVLYRMNDGVLERM